MKGLFYSNKYFMWGRCFQIQKKKKKTLDCFLKVETFPKIMGPHCDNILQMWGPLWLMGASIPEINNLVVRTLPKVF
jgi:hypothetical protein